MTPVLAVWMGLIIQITVNVVAVVLAYSHIRERLTAIETKLDPMWRQFERRRGTTGTTGVR